MRISARMVVAVLVLGGCHPRYDPSDGSGGSLGLDTVRTRIALLIASGNYAHALEYLESVEGLSQAEHD